MSLSDLQNRADRFWNQYSDISGQPSGVQQHCICGATENGSLPTSTSAAQNIAIAADAGANAGAASLTYAYSFGYGISDAQYQAAWENAGLAGTATQTWTNGIAMGSAGSAYGAVALVVAAPVSAGGVVGITEIGVVPISAIPSVATSELMVVGMTGTAFPAAYLNSPPTMVTVSRWGSDLQAGNWVMRGPVSMRNYLCSGKWQPVGQPFAPYSSGQSYTVPSYTVRPPHWVGDGTPGFDGPWKWHFGQGIYDPSLRPGVPYLPIGPGGIGSTGVILDQRR